MTKEQKKIQRWKPSKGDINKIKMEVSDDGKYVKYSDYLILQAAHAEFMESLVEVGEVVYQFHLDGKPANATVLNRDVDKRKSGTKLYAFKED